MAGAIGGKHGEFKQVPLRNSFYKVPDCFNAGVSRRTGDAEDIESHGMRVGGAYKLEDRHSGKQAPLP